MAEESNKLARSALRSSYATSIISIALVLFLTGILAMLIVNGKRMADYFRENYHITIILKNDVSEKAAGELAGKIAAEPEVKKAEMITKEQAAIKLSEELGEDFISFLGSNPLSHTIDVTFRAGYTDSTVIEKFVARNKAHPAVLELRYEPLLLDAINKNIRKMSLIVAGFALLLLVVMILLINNTIRISLYAKRLLIKSMQLVGATRGFIRKPFIRNSLFSGLYGALIAGVLLFVLFWFAQKQVPELNAFRDTNLQLLIFAGLVLLGMLISGVCTFFAVNRYLRKSFDELF